MQCPTCNDANACGDYEGPTCDTCGGVGFVAPVTKDEMKERVTSLTGERILNWMIDRYRNCERLAATKTGADQAGWLEDAMFFYAAIGLIKWRIQEGAMVARHPDRQPASRRGDQTKQNRAVTPAEYAAGWDAESHDAIVDAAVAALENDLAKTFNLK